MLAVFGDESLLRYALEFEAALARAQAAEGLIDGSAADVIVEACAALKPEIATLADEAAHAGTLAIPLVRQLRAAVASENPEAAEKVHLGSTSQDVMDTSLVLQAKAGLVLLDQTTDRILAALETLAEKHVDTPMLGRTLMQGALPITFGLKVANWLLAVDAANVRLRREGSVALALQFGGGSGTLAGLQGKGSAVAERLAFALNLPCPPVPWHTRRDGIAGLAVALSILAGAFAKIARDIALLAQDEISEAAEPHIDGRGGSSAMPHKRNPTGCQIAISASLRAPGLAMAIVAALPQEHERGLGGWQIEAPTIADLFCITHGAAKAVAGVIEGLELHPERMRSNLAAAGGGIDPGESAELTQRALLHYRKHK
jgi:3-carboxy-cis,cis-muconate cycloisomerase